MRRVGIPRIIEADASIKRHESTTVADGEPQQIGIGDLPMAKQSPPGDPPFVQQAVVVRNKLVCLMGSRIRQSLALR